MSNASEIAQKLKVKSHQKNSR